MTDREKAIISAYTGIATLTGEKFSIFHKYVEDIMGRPVFTHELADKAVWEEIKKRSKEDFIRICSEDEDMKRCECADEDLKDPFKEIADHYGLESQLDMLQEECAELIQAVSKYRRAKCTDDHLAEEIADVHIMTVQIIDLLDIEFEVNNWVDRKLQRQLERIKGEEHG
jgi:NTP pyrophosphatase (non-canonical NTP hydrolase)